MPQLLRRLYWRFLKRKPHLTRLQSSLGYFFVREDLLEQCITHKSIDPNPRLNYERLEFLGDAVIDHVISLCLLREFPESNEGFLTQKRAALVQRSFLAKMGKRLGLEHHIRAAVNVDLDSEKVSQKQLANVFEALVGGIYLDGGLRPCADLIVRTVWRHRKESWQTINYKGILLEYCQGSGLGSPLFSVTDTSGPEHEKTFEVTVTVGSRTFPAGTGETKKAAEQEAAEIALGFLRS
ncbi:MAG: ribonuclease III [Fidelibacterota bacterium]